LARKPNRTPEKVCRIAASLFTARGYHGTSMDDIAAGVQLNNGTLYYYFPSKSDILYTICTETVDAFIGAIDGADLDSAPPDRLEFLIREQLRMIVERPNEVAVFLQELRWLKEWLTPAQHREIRAKEMAFGQKVVDVIERGVSDGQFHRIDATIAARNIEAVVAWTSHWYRPKLGISMDHVADETVAMVLSGLGAEISPVTG
jgi:AcrR family transcriptional regulator